MQSNLSFMDDVRFPLVRVPGGNTYGTPCRVTPPVRLSFLLDQSKRTPMSYLFTSESVSEGHPDKIADQISDAILDSLLEQDPYSRVAVETLVTTGLVVLSGEVTTKAYVDVQSIAREVIREIGYTDPDLRFDSESCGVLSSIHEQSPDIKQGVDAGDDKEQ